VDKDVSSQITTLHSMISRRHDVRSLAAQAGHGVLDHGAAVADRRGPISRPTSPAHKLDQSTDFPS